MCLREVEQNVKRFSLVFLQREETRICEPVAPVLCNLKILIFC